MLTESQAREQRVRFKHPIRVVTLDGPPRVIRTLTTNVSRRGLFVRMPQPLPEGCRVALSLEAGGRALAFAQAQVAWGRSQESKLPGRFPGCGVRFTEFLHPKAKDLVEYLVENLDTGKPLTLPKAAARRRWWMIGGAVAGALGLTAVGVGSFLLLAPGTAAHEGDETLAPLVAVAPSPVELAPAAAPVPEASPVELAGPVEGSAPASTRVAESVGEGAGAERVAAGAEVAGDEGPEATARPAAEVIQVPAVAEPVVAAAPTAAKVAPPPEAKPASAPEPLLVAAPAPVPEAKEARRDVAAPAAPVAAPVPTAPLATASASKPAAFVPTTKGAVRLPSGGAVKLAWSSDGRTVRLVPTLAPGATLAKVFVLAGPSRAVFDVEGVAPKKSHQLEADAPHVSGVRVGKLGRGTRVVVDLQDVPVSHVADDGSLTLSF